ncbi:TetR/AcrR family transcriptional regulator [Fertoebacter nigrum]|uniref:TetR/AcrR family transcriptional regulator n=1 Tax=Fertoeibacter niger TaxID=2656921 RepID=A0A8X8H3L7_9RHOB|nr:TetR/AcrR family transcriptional regulator [Fertoeibacter niger]NUB45632.1 TetR/AcrR family transcriptional regulator [Fertoeibacter niger]
MEGNESSPEAPNDAALVKDRSRDRAATERRILDAAQSILTEQGSAGFGVNAVARAAGVDKQLIYRYFGGLDGLLVALGERLAEWWQNKLLADAPATPQQSYGDLMEILALRLVQIMRSEPLAQQCALWELTDASSPVAAITAARARALGAWMARARGDLRPPKGVDAPAINALIVSGISYFVLAGRTSSSVIGLETRDEATWARIESAVRALVKGVYHAP